MKIKFEWEKVSNNTYRAKVIGGWLVEVGFESINSRNWFTKLFINVHGNTLFIPDPNHEWEIDK